MESDKKKILLTYFSSTLRQYDLDFLSPGQWLNDQLITFYCEFLNQTIAKLDPSIVLMDAAVASSFPYI